MSEMNYILIFYKCFQGIHKKILKLLEKRDILMGKKYEIKCSHKPTKTILFTTKKKRKEKRICFN